MGQHRAFPERPQLLHAFARSGGSAIGRLHRLVAAQSGRRHRGRISFRDSHPCSSSLRLSYVYAAYGNVSWIASVFSGLKPAVIAVVAAAVIRIGKKALRNSIMIAIAALSFVAIFFFKTPFPVIVLGAGLIGLVGGMLLPGQFVATKGQRSAVTEDGYVVICEDPVSCHINPSNRRSILLILVFVLLWAGPMLMLYLFSGRSGLFQRRAFLYQRRPFSPLVAPMRSSRILPKQGLKQYAWLTGSQMIDGLGLAETTPGPLIMVVQFIGFLAGWNYPGVLSPLGGAVIGSLVATYFTFLPCFFFIFIGAPYIEKLRGNLKLTSALSSITAAVVGVVLNLAVWFGVQVLMPAETGFNWFGAILASRIVCGNSMGKIGHHHRHPGCSRCRAMSFPCSHSLIINRRYSHEASAGLTLIFTSCSADSCAGLGVTPKE